ARATSLLPGALSCCSIHLSTPITRTFSRSPGRGPKVSRFRAWAARFSSSMRALSLLLPFPPARRSEAHRAVPTSRRGISRGATLIPRRSSRAAGPVYGDIEHQEGKKLWRSRPRRRLSRVDAAVVDLVTEDGGHLVNVGGGDGAQAGVVEE